MGGCLSWAGSGTGNASGSGIGTSLQKATANVISFNGELCQFTVPVTASQVLHRMETNPTTKTSSRYFLCNSDLLYYDDYIPAMDPSDELIDGQIYFILPTTRLRYRLSASDMAALAVKASVALQTTTAFSSKSHTGRSQSQSQFHHYWADGNTKTKMSVNRKKKVSRISPLVPEVSQQRSQQLQLLLQTLPYSHDDDDNSNDVLTPTKNKDKMKSLSDRPKPAGLGVSTSASARKVHRYYYYSSKRPKKMPLRSFRFTTLTTIYEGSVVQFN